MQALVLNMRSGMDSIVTLLLQLASRRRSGRVARAKNCARDARLLRVGS